MWGNKSLSCLDLYHVQSLEKFSHFFEQEQCLEKVKKISNFGLKLAQPFLNTVPALKNWENTNSHFENLSSKQTGQ